MQSSSAPLLKTNVYVDGFNLYYGALRGTPYRWLDLHALCSRILPTAGIHRIRYFTARVNARPQDPNQPVRQDLYLRALETLPNVSIHLGSFIASRIWMPLSNPSPQGPKMAEVIKTEEKGSDVNLATFLLLDAFDGDFEQAVVISNDSDLELPIRMVIKRFGLPVGALIPHTRPSQSIKQAVSFIRQIRPGPLSASQFPATLKDANGVFTKPAGW